MRQRRGETRLSGEVRLQHMKCTQLVRARIRTANRRQQHRRDHADTADPKDNGADMQGTGDGYVVHARPYDTILSGCETYERTESKV